jgi:hypothetical protein
MRTKLIESNKPEKYIHNVRNVDTSTSGLTIPVGSPLVLNLSATPQPPVYTNGLPAGWEDGLQVVLPSTGGASVAQFTYGVATSPIIFQQLGESMVFGVAQAAYLRTTRANSTLPWTAVPSSAGFGQVVMADTVNNVLLPIGTVTPATTFGTLLDNMPALASSASSPTDTRTAITQLLRTFIRQM